MFSNFHFGVTLGDGKSAPSPVICPVPSHLQRRVDIFFFTSIPTFDELAGAGVHGHPKMLMGEGALSLLSLLC